MLHTSLLLLLACTPEDGVTTDTETSDTEDAGTATTYAFSSQFSDESSVSYSGQIFRHLLISELKSHVGGMTGRLDGGWFPEEGEVTSELEFYLDFDSDTSGSISFTFGCDPDCAQSSFDEISSDKNLWGKLAGNDPTGQHVDWSQGMEGWEGNPTPTEAVELWVAQLDEQAVAWSNGDIPTGPDGTPVSAVYLTEDGQDLSQLLQKFLLGAIAFSQGADDYLDDDTDGKGLLADNTTAEEGKPYTALEHAWDEGFGYFGAARDYNDWTDAEISEGQRDTWEADGAIDLTTETCWGHSANAGKRDAGAVVATDLSTEAFDAFLAGRAVITNAGGALSDAQLAELVTHRDAALDAWEKAIAATVVHYINDTLRDMGSIGTDAYSFADHAKHFSEAKGFALSLQFNPHSPLADGDFIALHELLGDAPVLTGEDELAAYADDLLAARALLGDAYGFDADNLGDDDGNNGW